MCALCISEYVEVCTYKCLYVLYYMYCVVYLCVHVLYLLGVLLSIYYVFTLFEYIKHIILLLNLIANKFEKWLILIKILIKMSHFSNLYIALLKAVIGVTETP